MAGILRGVDSGAAGTVAQKPVYRYEEIEDYRVGVGVECWNPDMLTRACGQHRQHHRFSSGGTSYCLCKVDVDAWYGKSNNERQRVGATPDLVAPRRQKSAPTSSPLGIG